MNNEVKLLTTRCIIIETEKIAKKTQGALTILKQYPVRECGHKEPIAGVKCLLTMISKKNEKHYIVATQDRSLQDKLRLKAGIPLLYLHNKSPTLEKPSAASYKKANANKDPESIMITENQNQTLEKMKIALGVKENEEEKQLQHKKKRKFHNPNPLSCLKSKKKKKISSNKQSGPEESSKKIRKRHRNKLPKHVKEQLKESIA